MKHVILLLSFMLGIGLLQAQLRLVEVDPINDSYTIKNFGSSMVNISDYRLCSRLLYTGSLSSLTIDDGSLMLAGGASVTISGFSVDDVSADLALYLPSGSFADAANMVDFMQYGAAGIGRESVAVTKGIWTAGEFIDDSSPFTYTGGGDDRGASFWVNSFVAGADYVAQLTGSQQVLPAMTMASGTVYLDLVGDTLRLMGNFANLRGEFNSNVAGGSHIHLGYAGQNGGIQMGLVPTLDTDLRGGVYEMANNTFVLTPEQKTALENRQLYVNIHTTFLGTGEIRGQILPKNDAQYMSNLFGSNQVPSRISEGSGALALDLAGDQLTVTGSFMNLKGDFNASIAGGAHLHIGAAGMNGGVDIPISATVNADLRSGVFEAANNTYTLTPEQVAVLRSRNYYANIHTTAYAPGELRGQVGRIAKMRFRAHLSGSNHLPVVMSMGTGEVLLEVVDSMLMVSGSFQNLGSDFNSAIGGGAHIHLGYAGQNGGVAFPLSTTLMPDNRSGTFEVMNNVFTLTAEQMTAVMKRQFYINIHSMNNPPGELRGQAVPEGSYFFNAFLSGTNHVTPVPSTGLGALKAEIRGGKMVVSGSFMNLSGEFNENIAGGSHLHLAMAGSNGPIQFNLSPTLDAGGKSGVFEPGNNVFDLSMGMKDTLKSRGIYANIHTTASAPGEIRGQLLHEATIYFNATLSGTSQPTAINSSGHGALMFEITAGQLLASGSFANLSSDFNPNAAGGAHIHGNFAGRNGGLLLSLEADTSTGNRGGKFRWEKNTFSLSPGLMDSLKNRMMYVNIHSTAYPPGEIRGQILPQAMAYFTTTMSGKNQVHSVNSTGKGGLKLELNGNKLVLSGGFESLVGEFNPDIAGGSHLHLAGAGMNGGIELELDATVAADGKSGIYEADSNTYMLTDEQSAAIKAGNLYFNVHTTINPPGELRGQILPESNFFPGPSSITSPADGSIIHVEGDGNMQFVATWESATDPNGNALAYTWQLAFVPDFSFVLVNEKVGQHTNFTTTFAEIDPLLALAGLQVGDTLSLYHRVISSDGSVCTEGMGANVKLIRGTITSNEEELLNAFKVKLFPSPVQDFAQLQVYAPQAGLTQVRMIDMVGRELYNISWQLVAGENKRKLDFRRFKSGLYLIQLQLKGQALKTIKILK